MPPAAYALVLTFIAMAVVAGIIAARVVGPRRRWTPIVPTLAAFGALYLVGHRLAFGIGPTVSLFGFDVSLLSDTIVALGTALIAAWVQRGLVRRRHAIAPA